MCEWSLPGLGLDLRDHQTEEVYNCFIPLLFFHDFGMIELGHQNGI